MSTGGLSTTFYEGEASQPVLPLLVGVKGNIFINIATKIFEREYVFNAIEHSFNFSNLKSNVSLIDHDRELTRVRVIQAVDRFIPYSIVPYFTDFIYLREVPSLTITNRAMLSSNQNSALISLICHLKSRVLGVLGVLIKVSMSCLIITT